MPATFSSRVAAGPHAVQEIGREESASTSQSRPNNEDQQGA